ncbi:hypothetical protein PVAND_001817 [Polypedilum vanderplanki]|uniref:MIF4G domain-containing protein n=1 Tax=Polypedilum vanderplanki TaxID=319348 RepID=A0A9J6BPI9_POLVA|nr:hypothetical protein PVAND_001817 [Polypedilum vanderplanki]
MDQMPFDQPSAILRGPRPIAQNSISPHQCFIPAMFPVIVGPPSNVHPYATFYRQPSVVPPPILPVVHYTKQPTQVEHPTKKSHALQIRDPVTGKDIIESFKHEKTGSLNKDAKEFRPCNIHQKTAIQSEKDGTRIKTSSPIQKNDDMSIIQEDISIVQEEDVSSPIKCTIGNENFTGDDFSRNYRYTKEELLMLKESLAVEKSKPPQFSHSSLICDDLDLTIYRILFDKTYQDSTFNDSYDISNSSYNKTNSSLSLRRSFQDSHSSSRNNRTPEKKSIIRMTMSQPNIRLNEAENAWVPSHLKLKIRKSDEEEKLEKLKKNFRSLLNKITAENFEHIAKEASNTNKFSITEKESLESIVDILFEKSITEPGFAPIYARLCKVLTEAHVFQTTDINGNESKKSPWKMYLIYRCQEEFERFSVDEETLNEILSKIDSAETQEDKDYYADIHFNYRYRAQGTIKFIGELYMYDLLNSNVMKSCIESLLSSITEENISRVCHLFTTIGKKFEENPPKDQNGTELIDKYMEQLQRLKNNKCITTSRIKFDIMNVIDLRKANWKPRENAKLVVKPKTFNELKEEIKKEKEKQEKTLSTYQPSKNVTMQSHNNFQNQNQRFKSHQQPRTFSNMVNIDFNKIGLNSKEVTLAPQTKSLTFRSLEPKSLLISNAFGALKVDCDDQELPSTMHSSRANTNKNSRKEKVHQQQITTQNSVDENSDDIFTIDLSNSEQLIFENCLKKFEAFIKGKLTMEMMITDMRDIKITDRILAMIYNAYLDKKELDQYGFIKALINLLKANLIDKQVNIEAIGLLFKLIPFLIPDVPLINTYIGEFLVKLHNDQMICIQDIDKICNNKEAKGALKYLQDSIDVDVSTESTNLIDKQVNIEAIGLLFKLIPFLIPDVPLINTYIGEFLVKLHNDQMICIQDIDKICNNKEAKGALKYLQDSIDVDAFDLKNKSELKNMKSNEKKSNVSDVQIEKSTSKSKKRDNKAKKNKNKQNNKKKSKQTERPIEPPEILCESYNCNNVEISPISTDNMNVQNESNVSHEENSDGSQTQNIKADLMKKIAFLLKKQKPLDEIYKLIDTSNQSKKMSFISELSKTIGKNLKFDSSKKYTDYYMLLERYIDNDIKKGAECLNAIADTFVSEKAAQIFELYYENNVVPCESLKLWCQNKAKNEKNSQVMYQLQNFLATLNNTEELNLE